MKFANYVGCAMCPGTAGSSLPLYFITSLRHYFLSGAFMAITIMVLPNNTDGSGSNLLYAIGIPTLF